MSAQSATPPSPATPADPGRGKWLTLLAACAGLAMLNIDLFIVNVALPSIARGFAAPLGTASWTIAGYVLMIATLPMGLGRLGDIWGQRRLYLAGLAIFVVASLACALAPSIGALIAARVVQGIGAAIMTPSTLAIATRAFPASERGLAVGIYGGVAGFGLVAGPVLGGLLVRGDNWHGIFLINLPLGLVAIALALRFVPEVRDTGASKTVDWWGLATLSLGLGGLMLALTLATEGDWRSPGVFVAASAGVVLLAAFVAIESRVRWPLIDLALFRNRSFVLASLGFFLFSAALFGSQPYWSLFMQNFWHYTPLQGGLAFVPATATIAILTPFTGLLAKRVGGRRNLAAAFGVFALGIGCGYVALIDAESTYVSGLLPGLLIRGVGIPIFSTFATLALLAAVPSTMAGLASGTLGMARNIGTAFGVALLGVIYKGQITARLADSSAGQPISDLPAVVEAATSFTATGSAATRALVGEAILGGFATISIVAALCCAVAAVACLLIRPAREDVPTAPPLPVRQPAALAAAHDD